MGIEPLSRSDENGSPHDNVFQLRSTIAEYRGLPRRSTPSESAVTRHKSNEVQPSSAFHAARPKFIRHREGVEDSNSDDTGHAEDDEAEIADCLPSIPEIIAKHGTERGRADTAGEQVQPTRQYLDGR